MKFSAAQLLALALCGLVALIVQPAIAQEPTTCNIECFGPYNECSWEVITASDREAVSKRCEDALTKCMNDCIAKNGKVKYVYKAYPHPESLQTTKPTHSKKPTQTKTAKRGNASLRTPSY